MCTMYVLYAWSAAKIWYTACFSVCTEDSKLPLSTMMMPMNDDAVCLSFETGKFRWTLGCCCLYYIRKGAGCYQGVSSMVGAPSTLLPLERWSYLIFSHVSKKSKVLQRLLRFKEELLRPSEGAGSNWISCGINQVSEAGFGILGLFRFILGDPLNYDVSKLMLL